MPRAPLRALFEGVTHATQHALPHEKTRLNGYPAARDSAAPDPHEKGADMVTRDRGNRILGSHLVSHLLWREARTLVTVVEVVVTGAPDARSPFTRPG